MKDAVNSDDKAYTQVAMGPVTFIDPRIYHSDCTRKPGSIMARLQNSKWFKADENALINIFRFDQSGAWYVGFHCRKLDYDADEAAGINPIAQRVALKGY